MVTRDVRKTLERPCASQSYYKQKQIFRVEKWAAKYGDQAVSSLPNCAWRDNGDLN